MKAAIYNLQFWLDESEVEILKKEIDLILKTSKFDIVAFTEYYFEPKGYTAVWLLGESHLAIHTFPEENRSYIELSSCNEKKNKLFKKLFNQRFL